jgi:hypothetical protein
MPSMVDVPDTSVEVSRSTKTAVPQTRCVSASGNTGSYVLPTKADALVRSLSIVCDARLAFRDP